MPQRLFANAVASSTCSSAITSTQTTITLQSTSGFLVPAAAQQFSATILDTGNPAYNPNSPLATPYEYVYCTGNNQGTNTLTVQRGVGGTSPRGFFAGATVSQTFLADDIQASFPIKFDEQFLNSGASFNLAASPSWARMVEIIWRARSGANAQTDTLACQFNNDAGTNYDSGRGTLGSTYASGGALLGQTSVVFADIPAATSSAPSWATGTLRILYPNVTTNERGVEGWTTRHDAGVSIAPQLASGNWRNTSQVISTITILLGAGTFTQCTFAAYAYP